MNNRTHTRKVLIADDSPDLARRLVDIVSQVPDVEIVGPAQDGDATLDLFDACKPEIAILDLQMPGKSGFEVIAELRRRHEAALLVVLTMHDGAEYRDRCLRSGADHFLSKATDMDRVPEIIREFGNRRT